MKPSGIICLEGADASGKTMLANHLVTCYGARYLHGRVWYDQVRWYLGMMRRAERLMEVGELVVIDRHWISELVYGPIFRGGAAWSNEMSAEFDARINDAPGVYVLCVPTDAKAHLARFEALKLQRREMFDSIEKVVQRYQDLLHGNIAHPGNNLVDLFIRFGDFRVGRKVYHHDIDQSRHNVIYSANRILEMLR